MWIFSIFAIISNFLLNYTKGFTTAEIMERRLDGIQTTLFTILIVTGFKPIFKLITNIIVFIKETISNKKLQTLEIKNNTQSERKIKMTDSNFTIGFVSGALFVTGLCFVFKYLFFSFLQLFNPNDTYPIIIQGSFNGGNFLMVFKTNSLF